MAIGPLCEGFGRFLKGTTAHFSHFWPMKIGRSFLVMSETVAWLAGHSFVLATALGVVIAWTSLGFALGLPKQWFLLSNILGTVVTLLLLLIMQHSQNRDMAALQAKVDELIRSSDAGDHMIGIERLEAEELSRLADERQRGA